MPTSNKEERERKRKKLTNKVMDLPLQTVNFRQVRLYDHRHVRMIKRKVVKSRIEKVSPFLHVLDLNLIGSRAGSDYT